MPQLRRSRIAVRCPAGRPGPGTAGLAILLVFAFAACDRHSSPPGEPTRPAHPAPAAASAGSMPEIPSGLARLLADAGGARSDGGVSAAERALSEIRERSIELPPRRVAAERLVFAKGRLGQLSDTALVVRDASTGAIAASVPVVGPRAVIALLDGSLLVAGATGLYRLDANSKTPSSLPHVTLFPESLLMADRRDKTAFWVLHEIDPTLYRYELPQNAVASLLAPTDFLPMDGYDASAFLALADGSFVYATKEGFRRFFPHGKKFEYGALDGPGKVWRLLPTHRQDQMWVIWSGGEAELVQLGAKVRRVRSFKLDGTGTGYDVASNDDLLALVRVDQVAGKTRKWALVVYDNSGKKRLDAPLPDDATVPAGEDWVRVLTRNRTLALAPRRPLVVVGGPDSVLLWDVDRKKQIPAPDAAR